MLDLAIILSPADVVAEQKIKDLKLNPSYKAVQYLQAVIGDSHNIALLDQHLAKSNRGQSDEMLALKNSLFKQILDNAEMSVSNNNSHIHSIQRLVIVKTLESSLDDVMKHFMPDDLSEYKSEITRVKDSMKSQINMLSRSRSYGMK